MEGKQKSKPLSFPENEICFVFETTYDTPAMTAMTKALRRTLRKKHSCVSHFVGWNLVAL